MKNKSVNNGSAHTQSPLYSGFEDYFSFRETVFITLHFVNQNVQSVVRYILSQLTPLAMIYIIVLYYSSLMVQMK